MIVIVVATSRCHAAAAPITATLALQLPIIGTRTGPYNTNHVCHHLGHIAAEAMHVVVVAALFAGS